MFSNIILFECPFQNYKNQKTVESENNIKAIIYCLWCRYKYKAYSFIINLTFHLLSEMLCGFKFRTTFKVFTLSLKVVFLFASSLVFTVYYILWFFCRNFLLSIFKTILLKIVFIKMFTEKKYHPWWSWRAFFSIMADLSADTHQTSSLPPFLFDPHVFHFDNAHILSTGI